MDSEGSLLGDVGNDGHGSGSHMYTNRSKDDAPDPNITLDESYRDVYLTGLELQADENGENAESTGLNAVNASKGTDLAFLLGLEVGNDGSSCHKPKPTDYESYDHAGPESQTDDKLKVENAASTDVNAVDSSNGTGQAVLQGLDVGNDVSSCHKNHRDESPDRTGPALPIDQNGENTASTDLNAVNASKGAQVATINCTVVINSVTARNVAVEYPSAGTAISVAVVVSWNSTSIVSVPADGRNLGSSQTPPIQEVPVPTDRRNPDPSPTHPIQEVPVPTDGRNPEPSQTFPIQAVPVPTDDRNPEPLQTSPIREVPVPTDDRIPEPSQTSPIQEVPVPTNGRNPESSQTPLIQDHPMPDTSVTAYGLRPKCVHCGKTYNKTSIQRHEEVCFKNVRRRPGVTASCKPSIYM